MLLLKEAQIFSGEETNITKNKYQILQEGFGGIKETKLYDNFLTSEIILKRYTFLL